MSKSFCNDDERRISRDESSAVIEYENLIGAKVKVKSASMQNGFHRVKDINQLFTVSDIGFRISIDGKCHTIISLAEITDRTFTLKDIEIVVLNANG